MCIASVLICINPEGNSLNLLRVVTTKQQDLKGRERDFYSILYSLVLFKFYKTILLLYSKLKYLSKDSKDTND